MHLVTTTTSKCSHCGENCESTEFVRIDLNFCCVGCQNVYDLLAENELCDYYQYNPNSGNKVKSSVFTDYDMLDNSAIVDRMIQYKSPEAWHVTLNVPGIHCSSCVYLLENLSRLDGGILKSEISFLKKELRVIFHPEKTTLKQIANLMASVGYAPLLNNEVAGNQVYKNVLTKHYIKLAIAGFATGNVMMFSFPEYVGGGFEHSEYKYLFPLFNLILSLPVLFYSGTEYYKSAWNSLKQKQINLDVPVTVGIFALFLRSFVDVTIVGELGFFDSFCAFVFFLLIGKTFQMKFYEHLNFERNYRSYYPLAVLKQTDGEFKSELVDQLEEGHIIRIRHQEIIPCDSILVSEHADIDYSFVTGENTPVKLNSGERIYAGGRIAGLSADLQVSKTSEKSYLNQLWSHSYEKSQDAKSVTRFADMTGRYFSYGILLLILFTFFWHLDLGWLEALNRVSAVAIVACPCALALAAPFTFGTASGLLAKAGFYFKDAFSIERFSRAKNIVFDKTGTLTSTKSSAVYSHLISDDHLTELKNILGHSLHPMSRLISESILTDRVIPLDKYEEIKGSGIIATVDHKKFQIGSVKFLKSNKIIIPEIIEQTTGSVHVAVNGFYEGYFDIRFAYRSGLETMFSDIEKHHDTYLISGDKDYERPLLTKYISNPDRLRFNCNPTDKQDIIESLNKEKITVMVGDGLNDSAALQAASVGISVVEDQSQFTPSCDAILAAEKIPNFHRYLSFAHRLKWVIVVTFGVSILYNTIGISLAFFGYITPLLTAILMPVSSLTVISIAIGMTVLFSWKEKVE